MKEVYIIAEIGCNHNGDAALAKRMVEEAYRCGVNAVKFQTFHSELLISKFAPKAEYQIVNTGNEESQLEMTRKLELSEADFLTLREYATQLGLDVFSTGFDEKSNDFLFEHGQTVWKIPSGEITNLPYLRQIRDYKQKNKKILLSTGMATPEEIQEAVHILSESPSTEIVLLHCNTEYPTEDVDVNIRAILDLQNRFPRHEIGFSDHSRGSLAAVLSVSYGVRIIEKHFTLDKNMPGPDHKASADPKEMRELCENARRAVVLLGSDEKRVTPSERKNKIVARKSIVAKRPILCGERFTSDNITCKRPGNGISPMRWDAVLGLCAEKDFMEDELITVSLILPQET